MQALCGQLFQPIRKYLLKLLTKPAEGTSHASALLKGSKCKGCRNTVFTPKSGRALQICLWKSQKYRKHGLRHRASFRKPGLGVRSNSERSQHAVCASDESSAPVSSHRPSSLSRPRSDGWADSCFVADSIRFHFQANQLSFFLFNSAFPPPS